MSNLKEVLKGLGYAAENSKRTQVATTGGTYQKARKMLDEAGVGDDVLDYGAGRGHGTPILRGESYEPFPQGDFKPDYTTPPDKLYDAVVNLNVLNVLPPDLREQVAKEILDRIRMDGYGMIGARSYPDVMGAKNYTDVGDGGIVTSRGTYQYGFGGENEGLVDFLNRMSGDMGEGKRFVIEKAPLAATGAKVKRVRKKRK